MAPDMTARLATLLDELGALFHGQLVLVPSSVGVEGAYGVATATVCPQRAELIPRALLLKLFVSEGDHESLEWALVFSYLDGRRVAPSGTDLHHLRVVREVTGGVPRWRSVGWERDEHDEWRELDVWPSANERPE